MKHLFALFLFGLLGLLAFTDVAQKRKIQLNLVHPAINAGLPDKRLLTQYLDTNGVARSYRLEVGSVECSENVCTRVPIYLFWNAFGEFSHYELPAGFELEKVGGIPFTEQDYKKLTEVLHKSKSAFQYIEIDDIVEYKNTNDEVDASSGATVLVDKSETVEGAVLTCFTLWHWANGAINDSLRAKTAESCQLENLHQFWQSKDSAVAAFALEFLVRRRAYDAETCSQVMQKATAEQLVTYLSGAPAAVHLQAVGKRYANASAQERIVYLRSLLQRQQIDPNTLLSALLPYVDNPLSYPETDLMLQLVEKHANQQREVIEPALSLLSHELLIARRAYWFLQTKALSRAQKRQMRKFKRKHKHAL